MTNSHTAPSPAQSRIVRCPRCGGDSVYAASNPFRPFCSERCKQMDFGAWANEGYRLDATPPREVDGSDDLVPMPPFRDEQG